MSVSVIIPTYNGAHKLPGVLIALSKQTYKDFRIIIVVDGSTDETPTVLESFNKTFALFKIVYQQNRGRSGVRNKGFENTLDDIIIFYDDDVVPAADSVERHVRFHHNHSGICSGSVFEKFDSKKSDIFNYKAYLSRKWFTPYSDGLSQLTKSNLFFSAANCSIKRDTFITLNGFNEKLTDCEDYDLAVRALQKDIPIYLDRNNEAFHIEEITIVSLIIRQRQYLKAKGNRFERTSLKFKRIFIYWFFSFKFWISIIGQDRLTILPRKSRYWLYDKVVFAWSVVFPGKEI